eukprot:2464464-Prymnesium_polylepis.2
MGSSSHPLEEVDEVLAVVVDEARDGAEHVGLDHKVRDHRQEAQNGKLGKDLHEYRPHLLGDRLLEVVLHKLEAERHRDQEDDDPVRGARVHLARVVVASRSRLAVGLAVRLAMGLAVALTAAA